MHKKKLIFEKHSLLQKKKNIKLLKSLSHSCYVMDHICFAEKASSSEFEKKSKNIRVATDNPTRTIEHWKLDETGSVYEWRNDAEIPGAGAGFAGKDRRRMGGRGRENDGSTTIGGSSSNDSPAANKTWEGRWLWFCAAVCPGPARARRSFSPDKTCRRGRMRGRAAQPPAKTDAVRVARLAADAESVRADRFRGSFRAGR